MIERDGLTVTRVPHKHASPLLRWDEAQKNSLKVHVCIVFWDLLCLWKRDGPEWWGSLCQGKIGGKDILYTSLFTDIQWLFNPYASFRSLGIALEQWFERASGWMHIHFSLQLRYIDCKNDWSTFPLIFNGFAVILVNLFIGKMRCCCTGPLFRMRMAPRPPTPRLSRLSLLLCALIAFARNTTLITWYQTITSFSFQYH